MSLIRNPVCRVTVYPQYCINRNFVSFDNTIYSLSCVSPLFLFVCFYSYDRASLFTEDAIYDFITSIYRLFLLYYALLMLHVFFHLINNQSLLVMNVNNVRFSVHVLDPISKFNCPIFK